MTAHPRVDIDARRAIEALRNGVPNRFAVNALGSWQASAEKQFEELCQENAATPRGMMVSGDFGTGKSHLLLRLRERAKEMGYATSLVVVSKEMPLGNPARVVPRILLEAQRPDMSEPGLPVIASRLKFDSRPFVDFANWADHWSFGDGWWRATLTLFERLQGAEEDRDAIARFWSGEPSLTVSVVRNRLREVRAASFQSVGQRPSGQTLDWQRLTFGARLCAATGLKGLVVFIDEVELIAQYSPLQRANSYINLAYLLGLAPRPELAEAPLVVVGAVTRDFDEAVIRGKHDAERVPELVKKRYLKLHTEAYGEAAAKAAGETAAKVAIAGMTAILKALPLNPPTEETVDRLLDRLTGIYRQAYPDWEPVQPRPQQLHSTTTVREVIRRWITEWDLLRYYGKSDGIVSETIGATRTEEVPELEDEQ